ncbi:MAG: sodium-independent anion transporter [Gemmatimonadetes bacterium]|nr:sodium-independent anion transporter [Gemmatimonadota bacterium]
MISPETARPARPRAADRAAKLDGIAVYEISGPFFFGAAEKFKETLGAIANPPKVLILRMRDVMALDSMGMHALCDRIRRSRHDRTRVLLTEVRSQPLVALGQSYLLDEIGGDNLFGSVEDALTRAREHVRRPQTAPGGAR